MPSLLAPLQEKAHGLLSAFAEHAFFLRKCQKNHVLWVSDFPGRHQEHALQNARHSLSAHGFSCETDAAARLLLIDLSFAEYEALLAPLPKCPPALPAHDALHPAYALCRLLLFHPSPLLEQPLPALRAVLKACNSATPDACLRLIPSLHRQCAALLREDRPLPHAAGFVLCDWLRQQEIDCTNTV